MITIKIGPYFQTFTPSQIKNEQLLRLLCFTVDTIGYRSHKDEITATVTDVTEIETLDEYDQLKKSETFIRVKGKKVNTQLDIETELDFTVARRIGITFHHTTSLTYEGRDYVLNYLRDLQQESETGAGFSPEYVNAMESSDVR
jgi:hypothetical protein